MSCVLLFFVVCVCGFFFCFFVFFVLFCFVLFWGFFFCVCEHFVFDSFDKGMITSGLLGLLFMS